MIGRIDSNILKAINNMNTLSRRNDTLLEQLSSGMVISKPSDNPSLFYRISKFSAELSGYSSFLSNVNEGISVLSILNDAAANQASILEKMSELASKAQSSTLNSQDRSQLQEQLNQYINEIDQIAKNTSFNSSPLLSGVYESRPLSIAAGVGQNYDIYIPATDAKSLGLVDTTAPADPPDLPEPPNLLVPPPDRPEQPDHPVRPDRPDRPDRPEHPSLASQTSSLAPAEGTSVTLPNPIDETTSSSNASGLSLLSPSDADKAFSTIQNAMNQIRNIQSSFGADEFILQSRSNLIRHQQENLQTLVNRYQEADLLKAAAELGRNQLIQQYGLAAIASMQETSQMMIDYLFPRNS
jgi:flagellin-like hook-associated protein FlgL